MLLTASVLGVLVMSPTGVGAEQARPLYACSVTSYVPYNTWINGNVEVEAHGYASCPAATEYKTLWVYLMEPLSLQPDKVWAGNRDPGIKSRYDAYAWACHNGSHG